MNREDIRIAALEAGLYSMEAGGDFACFEKFAALIAEDCAKRCDDVASLHEEHREHARAYGADTAAVAIREAYKP